MQVLEDYTAIPSRELLELAVRLAPYTQPAVLNGTEQGKAFIDAVMRTASPQQSAGWTTEDMAFRMLVAHHPEWQTHYAHAWTADRTTVNEIAAYLKKWPHLPANFVPQTGVME
jgi:hypothetical protein